ncbi:hypothetical protein NIES4073_68020 [Kalymmatonema gypsitolerans NIES-4073]|nr:hypothetical protein NIES4073_68020 [Scytonema sp. NIES-4073]
MYAALGEVSAGIGMQFGFELGTLPVEELCLILEQLVTSVCGIVLKI